MSESKEDYLEVIYTLIKSKVIARTGDISKMLNIKPPSVTEMLQKLHEEKLVVYEKGYLAFSHYYNCRKLYICVYVYII